VDASLASVIGGGEFAHLDGATMVNVTLSERNLRDLLAQWDSGRERPVLSRLTEDGYMLIVCVEPDSMHYARRDPGEGGVGKSYPNDQREGVNN
jgi:hypothetical protein